MVMHVVNGKYSNIRHCPPYPAVPPKRNFMLLGIVACGGLDEGEDMMRGTNKKEAESECKTEVVIYPLISLVIRGFPDLAMVVAMLYQGQRERDFG